MGLLDQILGGLAGGQARGRMPMGIPGGMGGGMGGGGMGGGGMNHVLIALLPVVLGMLANRQRGGMGGGMGGGGFGGMGGLGGLLDQFSQRGYGSHANSWVGTGQNMPLAPDELSQVFGRQQLADIASQAGVSEDEARMGLSQLLPEVVDHFTPGGRMPDQNQLLSSLDDYERRIPR